MCLPAEDAMNIISISVSLSGLILASAAFMIGQYFSALREMRVPGYTNPLQKSVVVLCLVVVMLSWAAVFLTWTSVQHSASRVVLGAVCLSPSLPAFLMIRMVRDKHA
jgi:hypothetical protein